MTVLRHSGIEVFACRNGGEAVALCEEIRPDAVLFDLDMPQVDGFEAARRLRENPALLGVRIVALTGRSSLDYRMRAVDCCFDQFLCKPIRLQPLLEALHMTQGGAKVAPLHHARAIDARARRDAASSADFPHEP